MTIRKRSLALAVSLAFAAPAMAQETAVHIDE